MSPVGQAPVADVAGGDSADGVVPAGVWTDRLEALDVGSIGVLDPVAGAEEVETGAEAVDEQAVSSRPMTATEQTAARRLPRVSTPFSPHLLPPGPPVGIREDCAR